MKTIGILDYNGGNIASVINAFEYVISNNNLKYKLKIITDPSQYKNIDMIIFPGQGAAKQVINELKLNNLIDVLENHIYSNKPYFGICIGLQILFDYSQEQDTKCLEIIAGEVIKFDNSKLKVPHVGWNKVNWKKCDFLFDQYIQDKYFYHIHSYYPILTDLSMQSAITEYGNNYCCAIQNQNIFATQFHPEKSGQAGLDLIYYYLKHYEDKCN
jgi:imidazole glycerol-phosphate synthase subunit HisH